MKCNSDDDAVNGGDALRALNAFVPHGGWVMGGGGGGLECIYSSLTIHRLLKRISNVRNLYIFFLFRKINSCHKQGKRSVNIFVINMVSV